MTKGPTQIDRSKPILVPARVAVCPGCDARLYIDIESWYDDDGRLRVEDFTEQCSREPASLRGKRRDAWEEAHRLVDRMPYVYWLPVHDAIEQWLKTVEIVDSEADRKKLAEWNVWAAGGRGEACQ